MIKKIISGGQTGADRGGLEAAKILGIKTGGWCPKNYKTENGPDFSLIDFGLQCTTSSNYNIRTSLNIQISDATIIFGNLKEGGSKLTLDLCQNTWKKIVLPVELLKYRNIHILRDHITSEYIKNWLESNNIEILNVAGNRESKMPGIQNFVKEFLVKCFS